MDVLAFLVGGDDHNGERGIVDATLVKMNDALPPKCFHAISALVRMMGLSPLNKSLTNYAFNIFRSSTNSTTSSSSFFLITSDHVRL